MPYSSKAAQQKKRSYLDPRTKIALMLMVVIFVLGGVGDDKAEVLRIGLSALPYILLGIERKWKELLRGGFILLLGYLLVYIPQYIGMGALGNIFLICGLLITRFAPGIVMGSYLMSTVTISEFIAAMERMHIPQSITIPMAVMFRFFPTVLEEMGHISQAMRMRGICIGGHKFAEVIEYRMVPTITCSVKIGDELSAAVLTRGLNGQNNRTNICCIGIRILDILIYLCCIVIGVWVIV